MLFKDILGQDRPIEILKNYLQSGNFPGAYLFCGEEGVGKYLTARNFAKAINCVEKADDPCDNCPSCRKIDKGEHPDVHFIGDENSEAIKIEYIRALKKEIALRPYEARKRVFIINDAHNLNAEAANALLKILEDPGSNSLIILITAKPNLLFKTIISRCQVIKFYPLKRLSLREILLKDFALDNNLAHYLAYFCEGRIGSALRLKDGDVLKRKNKVIDDFNAIKRNAPEALPIESRQDLRGCLNILAAWFRDMYLLKAGTGNAQLINLDRKDDLLKLVQRFSVSELDERLNYISSSIFYLEQNINIKLLTSNLKAQLWKA